MAAGQPARQHPQSRLPGVPAQRPGRGRQDAKLTTLYRLAGYLGWREFIRGQVQLLRFADEQDTRLVARFLEDVRHVLSSDSLDQNRAALWLDEQRAIGELMLEGQAAANTPVRGHAAFYRCYQETFAPWLERFAGQLLVPAAARSDRTRLLQWALYGLVHLLDEDDAYGREGWMARTSAEIDASATEPTTPAEKSLREHLAALR